MVVGALKLALLAEGAGETGNPDGRNWIATAPGEPIAPELFGAGHALVQRIAADVRRVPEAAVQLVRPLRLKLRDAKGSDLINSASLRTLLAWPAPSKAPHGTIVLIDADGDPQRARALDALTGLHPRVFVLAIQEFESWLLADHSALQQVLDARFDMGPSPDELQPGTAKQRWASLCAEHQPTSSQAALRIMLVRAFDFDRAASRSVSFAAARTKLRDFLTAL